MGGLQCIIAIRMMKTFALLLIMALAANAIPFPEDEVVPELYQGDSPTDYSDAKSRVESLMAVGKTDKDCREMAKTSKTAVEDAVSASQKTLDALKDGSQCKTRAKPSYQHRRLPSTMQRAKSHPARRRMRMQKMQMWILAREPSVHSTRVTARPSSHHLHTQTLWPRGILPKQHMRRQWGLRRRPRRPTMMRSKLQPRPRQSVCAPPRKSTRRRGRLPPRIKTPKLRIGSSPTCWCVSLTTPLKVIVKSLLLLWSRSPRLWLRLPTQIAVVAVWTTPIITLLSPPTALHFRHVSKTVAQRRRV